MAIFSARKDQPPYWPTSKAYVVLGRLVPLDVLETDRELGLEPKQQPRA